MRRVVLLAAAVVALAGCGAAPVALEAPVAASTSTGTTAAAALAALPVKGRAPKTGYSRAQFGARWADVDRNGCDQRNDVLRRDLDRTVLRGRCTVVAGLLRSLYTGRIVEFRRGPDTSDDVQIDHVVALSNAWQTGAQQLSPAEREQLANDPLNLVAVEGEVNRSKGDGDAATWLPPLQAARCGYVARQVAVKTRYRLWVTPPERDAIARVLGTCPDQELPM